MPHPSRIFFVGTGTEIGKTALVCALLRQANATKLRALPFKPAQSGPDRPSDVERLLRAAGLPQTDASYACPRTYAPPLAPGLAHAREDFLVGRSDNTLLETTSTLLATWESRNPTTELTLIEGAGGLHVPMPGGTWQPEWIATLADHVIVVASSGLGTINHTLLTLDALRAAGTPAVGVYFVDARPELDVSTADNADVIAAARNTHVLGRLNYLTTKDGRGREGLLEALLARLPESSNHEVPAR